jgi:Zn-dependent M28 family amino/carboxypeptidase
MEIIFSGRPCQFRQFFSGFPFCQLRFDPRGDHVQFLVGSVALVQVFSGYLASSANLHSTSCSIFINRSVIDTI